MKEKRVSIDLDSIPESARMQLVATVYEAAKEYIPAARNPGEVRAVVGATGCKEVRHPGAGIERLRGLHFVRYLSVKVVQR